MKRRAPLPSVIDQSDYMTAHRADRVRHWAQRLANIVGDLQAERREQALGDGNNDAIAQTTGHARLTVAAWGSPSSAALRRLVAERARAVLGILKKRHLYCLGTAKDGMPRHPLYLPASLKPVPWIWRG